MSSSLITIKDQFCGAGGSSWGASEVKGVEVRVAINHDPLAVETHNTNFPDVLHDCADISETNPRRYPKTTALITSPDCTHHTQAQGKQADDGQLHLLEDNGIDETAERSRATMYDVPRYAEVHDYEFIIVENVTEVRKWRLFDDWLRMMLSLGYEHKLLFFNSMFAHPTPQSRDRLYIVFWKCGNKAPDLEIRPLAFCPQCERNVEAMQIWKHAHSKSVKRVSYGPQYIYCCPHCTSRVKGKIKPTPVEPYYYAALNAIDWSIEAERIGERQEPLKPKTLDRIRKGLGRFGQQVLMIPTDRSYKESGARTGLMPLMTQTTAQSVALVAPQIVETLYGGERRLRGMDETLPTQTGRQSLGVVHVPFMISTDYWNGMARGVDGVVPTQITTQKTAVVQPAPCMVMLRGTNTAKGLDEPIDTVVSGGLHHGLLSGGPLPFLISYYGTGNVRDVQQPVATVVTVDRHGLVEPGEEPRLEDCTFRMLQPHEIQAAMAFPPEYVVLGNNRQQVRQLGQAVTPPVMKMLVQRCVETLK